MDGAEWARGVLAGREAGLRMLLRHPGLTVVAVRRAFFQLVAGTVLGIAVEVWFVNDVLDSRTDYVIDPAVILAACAAFMLVVGMLACVGPTVRGLRIRPVEALKEG